MASAFPTSAGLDDPNVPGSSGSGKAEKTEEGGEEKGPNSPEEEGERKGEDNSRFECNICLDTAHDAVISMCGHLFCWPCLHQWLETRPNRQVCPVCKSAIDKEKVIPLYGRGGNQTDPRNKAPPRPQGQRSEPTNNVRETKMIHTGITHTN